MLFLIIIAAISASPAKADSNEVTTDRVKCNSDEYRNYLSSLSTDLFKVSVQSCLDLLRKEAIERNANSAAKKNEPLPWKFHAVGAGELPKSCPSGSLEDLKKALQVQLENCGKANDKRRAETREFACRKYTRQEWCIDVNQKMLSLAESSSSFGDYLEKTKTEFAWFQSNGWEDGKFQGKTQFTGYHAPPPIDASSVPSEKYSYPVYRHPADLVTIDENSTDSCGKDSISGIDRKICRKLPSGEFVPFPDRNEIDNEKALKGQGLEIAWVKDPVEVAFLMVEGSGSLNIKQPDGSVKFQKINYDGSNGRTLNMLGRIILCEGAKPEDYSSLVGIKAFLAAHPATLNTTLAFDQSYVFYKSDNGGPYGADGIPITSRHSFATDRRLIPTGAAMMVHSKRPGGKTEEGCEEVTSIGLSQDSGGAINGPHVDWYLGEGQEAQDAASDVNQTGDLFVALPKDGGKEIAGCVVPPLSQPSQ